jgi:hypothetical protein
VRALNLQHADARGLGIIPFVVTGEH